MAKGRIVKGIAGFYYVRTARSGVYECKARGAFRNEGIKPAVGDWVEMEVAPGEEMKGNIVDILPRRNFLIRPTVANVDQAVMVFALASPDPNFNLLDRLIILALQQGISPVLCMTKTDLVSPEEVERVKKIYEPAGYPLVFLSNVTGGGYGGMKTLLSGKTSTLAGPSGAGKSTMINALAPHANMETGEISRKIKRGKNTTRHSELIAVDDDTFIVDTPGFGTVASDCFLPRDYAPGQGFAPLESGNLDGFFPEFASCVGHCRFRGCSHVKEPDCAVKEAVGTGAISRERYASYLLIYDDLRQMERDWKK